MKSRSDRVLHRKSTLILGLILGVFLASIPAEAWQGRYGVNRTISVTRYWQKCAVDPVSQCSYACIFNDLEAKCQIVAPGFCNPGDTFISASYGGDYPPSNCSYNQGALCYSYDHYDFTGSVDCRGSCNALCEEAPEQESPVLVSVDNGEYDLTSLEDGVSFDLNADGAAEELSWTAAGSDEAFVVLDRDGNGWIDDGTELFGNVTEQDPIDSPNGFNAMKLLDTNSDGWLDSSDARFADLGLWFDHNHNGLSEPEELVPFSDYYESIDLDYRAHPRTDQHGNRFGYRTKLYRVGNGVSQAYDVFFVTEP